MLRKKSDASIMEIAPGGKEIQLVGCMHYTWGGMYSGLPPSNTNRVTSILCWVSGGMIVILCWADIS